MKKSFGLIITCKHNNPNNIIRTMDGENVCKCGVILEEKIPDDGEMNTNSCISLYHQVENGCDPKDMKVINKKIHIHTSSSSEFSNICSKLMMPNFIQKRAWYIYDTLRVNTSFSRAKCATFATYVACREGGNPKTESQIQEAIRSILCVKNSPNILNVIYEMHDTAFSLGINTNEGHTSSYYLNLAISEKQHLFDDKMDYEQFTMRVKNSFVHLRGNYQNKAKRAVDVELLQMGLK